MINVHALHIQKLILNEMSLCALQGDAVAAGSNVSARPSASQDDPGIYSYPDEEDNEESPYVAVTYDKKEQSDEEEELCQTAK